MKTIRQHEALRVPLGWKDQDKALIAQLERIFDDIYRRFGRLAWEDLGEKLQEKINGIEEGAVTAVTWDGTNKKLTVTINDTVNDVVTIATIKAALDLTKSDVGLGNVENKSSATIRSEITSQNVTDALGYTPPSVDTKNTTGTTNKAGTKLYLVGAETQATNPQTNSNSKVYIGTDNCLYSNDTKVLTAHQDISGKADKVSGATNNDLASLDSNGNLKDAGVKASDLQTKTDSSLATTATTVVGAINELNGKKAMDDGYYYHASATSHALTVPTNSRNVVIVCTNAASRLWIGFITRATGDAGAYEILKGSNTTVTAGTSTVTVTFNSSAAIHMRVINVYGGNVSI